MQTNTDNNPKQNPDNSDKDLPGNYPPSEDIYNHDKKIKDDINLDNNFSKVKEPVEDNDERDDVIGENPRAIEHLDVPGSELDDANEDIGQEDEENNYYSLGGDNHDE